jgi:magnesium-transporting ATPase (P-type)
MGRPPREPGSPILSRPVVERILLVGVILLAAAFVLFEVALVAGLSDAQARTVAVNTFIAVQIFYLFNARTLTRSLFRVNPFSNPVVLAGVAVMVALQLLFTYVPFMNTAFSTEPFPAVYWVPVVLAGVAGMLIVEAAAAWQRRRAKHGMVLGR